MRLLRISSLVPSRVSAREAAHDVRERTPSESVETEEAQKSSFRHGLRRLLHIRYDSAHQSDTRSRTNAHMPLDPKTAEAYAIMYMAQKEGVNPEDLVQGVADPNGVQNTSDRLSVRSDAASMSASVTGSSSGSEATVVVHGPLDPLSAQAEAIAFLTSTGHVTLEQHDTSSSEVPGSTTIAANQFNDQCDQALSLSGRLDILEQNDEQDESKLAELECLVDAVEKQMVPDDQAAHSGPMKEKAILVDSKVYEAFEWNSPAASIGPTIPNSPKKRKQRRGEANKPKLSKSEKIERDRHRVLKQLAYNAGFHGYCWAFALIKDIIHILSSCDDPQVTFSNPKMSFRKSELSQADWKWLHRGELIQLLQRPRKDGLLSEEHYEIIHEQLFPDPKNLHVIMPRQQFEVFMADFVWEDTWCDLNLARRILNCKTAAAEGKGDKSYKLPKPVRFPTPEFKELPQNRGVTTYFTTSRFQALVRLIEAAVYCRQYWAGLFYTDPAATFDLYFQAHSIAKSGNPLPAHLLPYARNWSFHEQRLFRVGDLLIRLLRQVRAEKFDLMVYRVIRGTLLPIMGQPFVDTNRLQSFCYSRGLEEGLSIEEIPKILVLHPDVDVACENEEVQEYARLVDEIARYKEEERQRLADIKTAKKAWKKATRVKRVAAIVKRTIKKAVGRYKKPAGSHCTECAQGGPCLVTYSGADN